MLARKQKIPNLRVEKTLQKEGYLAIAGVDEAGRGAWAGPVVAAAVVLPHLKYYYGINDSKLLTPLQRELLLEKIYQLAVDIGIGISETSEVDDLGVGRATYLAMRRAVGNLSCSPQYILVDGFKVGFAEVPSQGIIDGDRKSVSIAAASIVAKVARDRMMREIHLLVPHYNFHINKGYGTPFHQMKLKEIGICEWHRKSYQPIKQAVSYHANLEMSC
ncbi:MAG: ribonuclease HII [Patescibacteria group bacterium]